MKYGKATQIGTKKKSRTAVNKEANKKIKSSAKYRSINYCELDGINYPEKFLAPAHKHKRVWYRGKEHLLSSEDHWIKICTSCHGFIESKPYLTQLIFKVLRGGKNEQQIKR